MKDYSYHSLFYYKILSALRGFVGGDGNHLSRQESPRGAPNFYIGWHPRVDYQFNHNYERNRFLNTRDRYVLGESKTKRGHPVIVVREINNSNVVVIYEDAIKYLFDDDYVDALRELTLLLEKFYRVTIEDRSDLNNMDMEREGRHGSHVGVNNLRNDDTELSELPF